MPQKTLEEIKADIAERAGQINPFERVEKEDVDQVLKNLSSLDSELWGREWGKVGAMYEALGDELEKQSKKKQAGETFFLAYDYYRVGRYPVPSSPSLLVRRSSFQPSTPPQCITTGGRLTPLGTCR